MRQAPRPTAPAMRVWELGTVALTFVLLSAASLAVSSTIKAPGWAILWQSVFLGLLSGWAPAVLRMRAWTATALVLAGDALYLLIAPGGLAGEATAIVTEAAKLAVQFMVYPEGGFFQPGALAGSLADFGRGATIVGIRVQDWIASVAGGKAAFDQVAATLAWNALIWCLAAWAGWTVETRRNAILATLPAILLTVGTLGYASRTSPFLYLMLAALLALMAVTQQEERGLTWERLSAASPRQKGRQIVGLALTVTLGLVAISALFSSSAIERIQEWISERRTPSAQQESALARSLGIEPASGGGTDAFGATRKPSLPRSLLIGSGPELSRRSVMTVKVNGAPAAMALYWRSFTYDLYTGQGWSTSQTHDIEYRAQESVAHGNTAFAARIEQRVHPIEDLGGTVYGAGEPMLLNQPVQAAWRSPDDLLGLQMHQSVQYDLISAMPTATEAELQAAGEAYPAWVRKGYLTLPAEVPDRVKTLAAQLTASERTPYERARAIESYLRKYPYTLDVPRPPLRQDLVDYFLFDLRKGYCDYYASAMVVLARASGVPARLAVGYATGTYNLNSRRYLVTEADAHSWAEVYFPRIGWVPFEATASRPELQSTTGGARGGNQNGSAETGFETARPGVFVPWPATGMAALVLSAVALSASIAADIRLRRLPAERAAAEIFRRLRGRGVSLGAESHRGDTPHEFAASLKMRVIELTGGNGGAQFAVRTIEDIDKIADGIVRAAYEPAGQAGPALLKAWRRLEWRLRWTRAWERWHSMTNPEARSIA